MRHARATNVDTLRIQQEPSKVLHFDKQAECGSCVTDGSQWSCCEGTGLNLESVIGKPLYGHHGNEEGGHCYECRGLHLPLLLNTSTDFALTLSPDSTFHSLTVLGKYRNLAVIRAPSVISAPPFFGLKWL